MEASPLQPLAPPDLPPVPDSDSEDDQLEDDTEEEDDDEDSGDDAAMVQGRHGASPPGGARVGCCLVSRHRPDSDRADRARPAGPGPACAVAFSVGQLRQQGAGAPGTATRSIGPPPRMGGMARAL